MKLTKEEARWLDDKWNDFYYYFQVEDMFEKDQEIFKNIGKDVLIESLSFISHLPPKDNAAMQDIIKTL